MPTRPALHRELLLGLAVFAVYTVVASAPDDGTTSLAAAHGRSVLQLERMLHINVELVLNRWLNGHPAARIAADYEYATTYIVSAFTMLGWLYVRRPDRYRTARNSFALLNLVGALCFAVYPVMPPRFMPEFGFVDTVRDGHTWGSWGSPLVDHADTLAAMPSLHVAWALWVSVELARVSGGRRIQLLSLVHVLATAFVIMATANHFVLDAVGAVVLTFTVTSVVERSGASARSRVQAADAFFLAVESRATPQNVGGVALLDTSVRTVTRQDLVDMVALRLDELPRFRQRLSRRSRWRRPSWEDHPVLDWDWHVPVRRLPDPGGMGRLWDVVAGIQAEPLPLDRPLWRLFLVENVAPGTTAVVLITHHVVADGVGVVAQALRLMEPVEAAPPVATAPEVPATGTPEAPVAPPSADPGALRTAAGIVAGIARLATDGRQDVRLPSGHTAERRFAGCDVPFEPVIRLARSYGVRISDVILCAFAGGLYRVCRRPSGAAGPALCRVAVPLTMRAPGTSAEGNVTAAVMVDLPVDARPEPERLADIAARRDRLHTGSRALAARFVMRRVGQLMPPPLHAVFARAVYGRRTFQAIVSNLPGPKTTLTMAGAVLTGAFPILPLAPGAPLAVGALSWEGRLHVGISADPVLLEEPHALAAAMREVLAELTAGRDDR